MAALNSSQRAAVEHRGSPLLVLAGAGSGKTRVITHKIAWLLKERAVSPEAIAAVTFTNKAAREMKTRVQALISEPKGTRGLTISTFHSLGLKILKQEVDAAGLRQGFSLIDPKEAVSMLGTLLRSTATTDTSLLEQIQSQISAWKNAGLQPDKLHVEGSNPVVNTAVRIFPEYERYLRACNAVDLDDLILLPARLLQDDAEIGARWRARLRYLLVDEYQDTNGAQYAFLKALSGGPAGGQEGVQGSGKGLMVVGDDDQSIYGWRGAMPENLMQLKTDFPALEVIKLEQNYRSVGRVLTIANHLIEHNTRPFEKTLWSELGYGDPVQVVAGNTDEHEAERVVSAILKHQFQHKSDYSQFAILYRSNHQARVLEKKLRELRIPYQLSGSISFFDRAEIRDMLAYLRLLTNPDDDRAFLRAVNTPRRGLGAGSLEKLAQFAAARNSPLFEAVFTEGVEFVLKPNRYHTLRQFCARMVELGANGERGDPVKVFQQLLEEIAYFDWLKDQEDLEVAEKRWANVEELISWMQRLQADAEGEPSLADLVNQIVLRDILDRQDDESERNEVALMTLHAAKGLEFDHVYIVGVEDGILPHRNSMMTEEGVEEERRLLYVGITRAMRSLSLSYAKKRRQYGEVVESVPSRFLAELPRAELQWDDDAEPSEDEQKQTARAHIAQLRQMLASRSSV